MPNKQRGGVLIIGWYGKSKNYVLQSNVKNECKQAKQNMKFKN